MVVYPGVYREGHIAWYTPPYYTQGGHIAWYTPYYTHPGRYIACYTPYGTLGRHIARYTPCGTPVVHPGIPPYGTPCGTPWVHLREKDTLRREVPVLLRV